MARVRALGFALNTTKGKGKAKKGHTGYKLKGALKPPRTVQYTAKALFGEYPPISALCIDKVLNVDQTK